MSVIVKYSDASTYTLLANKVSQEYTATLEGIAHVPYSGRNIGRDIGLGFSNISIAGDILDKTACKWSDIVGISLDSGTTYQTVLFSSVSWGDDTWSAIYPYVLSIVAQNARQGTSVRYPTTGYKWGAQSESLSQAGSAYASPTITILPPSCAYPLSQSLLSYEGSGIVFSRALAKVHAGISYAIDVPAYDNGLYLGSDTSSDVAVVTLPTATVRTVACQIKQTRFPSAWAIGGGGVNLLTANQSNAETNTTGVAAVNGTLTRNTVTPIAGTGDFKVVATAAPCLLLQPSAYTAITANRWYAGQALVNTSGCAAGRTVHSQLTWYDAGLTELSSTDGVAVAAPTTATLISVIGLAPATAAKVSLRIWLDDAVASEIMYVDSLMLELLPTTFTVWTVAKNKLTIDPINNLLKWTDDTTTVSAAFPTASYMTGTVVDAVVIDGTSHAVTVIAHAAGGAWTTQTGTLAAILWPALTLGVLEGSLAWLTQWDYALVSAEYQAIFYSLAPWKYNSLRIPLLYAGTHVCAPDLTLSVAGYDHSGLVGGAPILAKAVAVTLQETGGMTCRWYAELAPTNTP